MQTFVFDILSEQENLVHPNAEETTYSRQTSYQGSEKWIAQIAALLGKMPSVGPISC